MPRLRLSPSLTWLVAGSFLVDCLLAASLSASPRKPLYGVPHNTERTMQSTRESASERKSAGRMKDAICHNLTVEGTSYHFGCSLFIRNKLLGSFHTLEEITQGQKSLEPGQKLPPSQSHLGNFHRSCVLLRFLPLLIFLENPTLWTFFFAFAPTDLWSLPPKLYSFLKHRFSYPSVSL